MMIQKITLFLLLLSSLGLPAQSVHGVCDLSAGRADSYVLAMSSQPGFCQTYGYEAGKPECLKLSKNAYEAKHLVLHGLWPNQDNCGQSYGFCGVKPKPNHCDYASVPLSETVGTALQQFMPSFRYGSCLERHEWFKHGSCQVLSADDYFTLAMRLTAEMDQSLLGHYLTDHNGQRVMLASIREVIVQSFGKTNRGKIFLGCKNGVLVDVFVALPVLLAANEPLQVLIEQAPDYRYRDACPKKVFISNFNKGLLMNA